MSDNKPAKQSAPFWSPLSAGGCLWRSVLFLLGMILLCFIFALLMRGCDSNFMPGGGGNQDRGRDSDGGRGRDGDDREYFYDPEKDEYSQPVPDTIPPFDERDKAPVGRDR
ncbi:MAG: hypothetical protein K2I52_06185, partial [Muribaculaceae bacterium]|nr:hypothetical protein [Muribaculaceae bacterium]